MRERQPRSATVRLAARMGAALIVAGALLAGGVAIPFVAAAPPPGPLIIGNNAGNGDGPIETYDFTVGGAPFASFVPDGALPDNNGRGVAIIGNDLFYTELDPNFSISDFIHVAPFNGGLGGADSRLLANPGRSIGIAALAASEGVLYVLAGYSGSGPPAVWNLDPVTGSVISGPLPLGSPADANSDGFTVLPNGNYLVNTGDASCEYAEFDFATGLATGASFTVPGATECTGVETDGTSLYIATDFDSFTKTDLAGNVISSVAVSANLVEDIALIRVVEDTRLTELSPVHAWIGLKNSDDQGTQFDLRAELLLNDDPTAITTGLTRCITGVTRNPNLAMEAIVEWGSFRAVQLFPDDVLTLRLSTRVGTTGTGAKCAGPGGSHNNALGLRLYYDSASRPSRFDLTIDPEESADVYLRSDGGACTSAQSMGVTTRWLDPAAPAAVAAKCKDSAGVNFAGGNPWKLIGTWTLGGP